MSNFTPPPNPNTHPAFMTPQGGDDFDLKSIFYSYVKYWPHILFTIILGVGAAYVVNKYATPIYMVEATVVLSDEKPDLTSELFSSATMFTAKTNTENEMGILKSFSVAEAALSKLNFNVSYFREDVFGFKPLYGNTPVFVNVNWKHPQITEGLLKLVIVDDNSYQLLVEKEGFQIFNPSDPFYKTGLGNQRILEGVYKFGEEVAGEYYKFSITNITGVPGDMVFFHLIDTKSLAMDLMDNLTVLPINKQASIVRLSIETPVRRMGEDYLNKLMESFLDRELSEKNRISESTVDFINSQLSGVTDSLSFFENRLQQYRRDNRVFNLSQEGNRVFENLVDFENQRVSMSMMLKYYYQLRDYLASENVERTIAPSIGNTGDNLLNTLVASLIELQSESIKLSANFSDDTPAVRELRMKIANAKRVLSENVNSSIRNMESNVDQINQRIAVFEREASLLPETERQLVSIQRQFTINENIYVYLLEKRAEAEIQRASNYPKNSILDYARAQVKPVSPKKLVNYLIGFGLGLGIPLLLITIKNIMNSKIEDPKFLEKKKDIPFLGVIGKSKLGSSRVVLESPKSGITESFRSLRSDMSYLAPKEGNLTILFTSSISGEGKTFCSINMASVYALTDKKVILLGLDLRKPRIANDFGLSNEVGMSTYLSSNINWKSVVKKTELENLDVILSGPIPPNPAELLLQDKFTDLMAELKTVYDVIILDCPPVGLVSETKELFKYADVNIYVFRYKYSEKENFSILEGLKQKGEVSKVYTILNDFSLEKGYGAGYGYGYGYGQDYGYYEDETGSRKKKKAAAKA